MRLPFILVLFCSLSFTARATQADNYLVKDPQIECHEYMIFIEFNTLKPFTGRVYVKGLEDDDRCSRNFATNIDQNRFVFMVQKGDCSSMTRQITNQNSQGFLWSLTVTISFHGTFVTSTDQTYAFQCFYRNVRRMTGLIDLIGHGTTEPTDTYRIPECSYRIHGGEPNGPLLSYGKVGDKIFHVWECSDEGQGFLVHSCWVTDGRGNRFDLLDIDGCAVDPSIQGDLVYEQSLLKAYIGTEAYKFSGSSTLNFQCIIELCRKEMGDCDGLTPPMCGRAKRSVHTIIESAEDTMSEYLPEYIIDVTASIEILEMSHLDDPKVLDDFLVELSGGRKQEISESYQTRMCMPMPIFGIILAISVILFATAVVTTCLLCHRVRYFDKSKQHRLVNES